MQEWNLFVGNDKMVYKSFSKHVPEKEDFSCKLSLQQYPNIALLQHS